MSKFEPLTAFLSSLPTSERRVTFGEIERILGFKLPPSARRHRPWWSNNPDNSAITKAWLAAGFRTEQVDMAGESLVFRKARQAAHCFFEDGACARCLTARRIAQGFANASGRLDGRTVAPRALPARVDRNAEPRLASWVSLPPSRATHGLRECVTAEGARGSERCRDDCSTRRAGGLPRQGRTTWLLIERRSKEVSEAGGWAALSPETALLTAAGAWREKETTTRSSLVPLRQVHQMCVFLSRVRTRRPLAD